MWEWLSYDGFECVFGKSKVNNIENSVNCVRVMMEYNGYILFNRLIVDLFVGVILGLLEVVVLLCFIVIIE